MMYKQRRQRTRTHLFVAFYSLLLLTLVPTRTPLLFADASTQIKWTAANENEKNDPAATAPKSQRYWDEHNIERPDYAKTDQEVASEKSAKQETTTPSSRGFLWWVVVSILVAIVGFVGYYLLFPVVTGGSRLGGKHHHWIWWRVDPEEATRQARLAKFQQQHASGKHE